MASLLTAALDPGVTGSLPDGRASRVVPGNVVLPELSRLSSAVARVSDGNPNPADVVAAERYFREMQQHIAGVTGVDVVLPHDEARRAAQAAAETSYRKAVRGFQNAPNTRWERRTLKSYYAAAAELYGTMFPEVAPGGGRVVTAPPAQPVAGLGDPVVSKTAALQLLLEDLHQQVGWESLSPGETANLLGVMPPELAYGYAPITGAGESVPSRQLSSPETGSSVTAAAPSANYVLREGGAVYTPSRPGEPSGTGADRLLPEPPPSGDSGALAGGRQLELNLEGAAQDPVAVPVGRDDPLPTTGVVRHVETGTPYSMVLAADGTQVEVPGRALPTGVVEPGGAGESFAGVDRPGGVTLGGMVRGAGGFVAGSLAGAFGEAVVRPWLNDAGALPLTPEQRNRSAMLRGQVSGIGLSERFNPNTSVASGLFDVGNGVASGAVGGLVAGGPADAVAGAVLSVPPSLAFAANNVLPGAEDRRDALATFATNQYLQLPVSTRLGLGSAGRNVVDAGDSVSTGAVSNALAAGTTGEIAYGLFAAGQKARIQAFQDAMGRPPLADDATSAQVAQAYQDSGLAAIDTVNRPVPATLDEKLAAVSGTPAPLTTEVPGARAVVAPAVTPLTEDALAMARTGMHVCDGSAGETACIVHGTLDEASAASRGQVKRGTGLPVTVRDPQTGRTHEAPVCSVHGQQGCGQETTPGHYSLVVGGGGRTRIDGEGRTVAVPTCSGDLNEVMCSSGGQMIVGPTGEHVQGADGRYYRPAPVTVTELGRQAQDNAWRGDYALPPGSVPAARGSTPPHPSPALTAPGRPAPNVNPLADPATAAATAGTIVDGWVHGGTGWVRDRLHDMGVDAPFRPGGPGDHIQTPATSDSSAHEDEHNGSPTVNPGVAELSAPSDPRSHHAGDLVTGVVLGSFGVGGGLLGDWVGRAMGQLSTRAPGVAVGQVTKATVTTASKERLTPEQERALSALNRDPAGTLLHLDEFARRMGGPGRHLAQAALSEMAYGALTLSATVLAAPAGPVGQIPLVIGAKGVQKGVLDRRWTACSPRPRPAPCWPVWTGRPTGRGARSW